MPPRQFSIAIVGADYPNKRGIGRRFELTQCEIGESLELRPEPKNPKDEHAIAVFSSRGVQIGYVAAERGPWIGKLMAGHEVRAVFQGHSKFGAWARLAFDGEVPALPPPQGSDHSTVEKSGGDDPFWPDPIYEE